MQLVNQTKNIILAEEVLLADNFLSRLKGLLGEKVLEKNRALIIQPCNAVHTFFMRFPIDIIFLNKDYKIIKIISCLKPFGFSGICWGAHLVAEFPSNTLNPNNSTIGDTLQRF